MLVENKTANGTNWVPIEAKLLPKGIVFITEEINICTATEFLQKIMYLRYEKRIEKIRVYINSPGGEVTAGMLIYDTIKGLDLKCDLICSGMAASMAAIILAAGEKGHRFILPHSKVMIHEPLIEGGVGGSASTIKRTAESIIETKRISVELLAQDTGKTIAEVEEAISYDNYMNAKEAVDFGIADCIIKR